MEWKDHFSGCIKSHDKVCIDGMLFNRHNSSDEACSSGRKSLRDNLDLSEVEWERREGGEWDFRSGSDWCPTNSQGFDDKK